MTPSSIKSRRRSVVVIVKWGLLLAALAILVALIALPLLKAAKQKEAANIPLPVYEVDTDSNEDISAMIKPHFQGVDKYNRPYNITADTAIQEGDNKVLLRQINGNITLQDEAWYKFSADAGAMIISRKTIDAYGNINIINNDGYDLLTESAHINLGMGTVSGLDPVTISGPPGTLDAQGFSIENDGETIRFDGPVTLIIHPKQTKQLTDL